VALFSKVTKADPDSNLIKANCSVCGRSYKLDISIDSREVQLCRRRRCRASGRAQGIAYALARYVFEEDKPLSKVRKNRDIRIVGLSDDHAYARVLQWQCTYTNTFYHTRPFLDISNPDKMYWGHCDALISADVFEHVMPPVSAAFEGAAKMLRPGGHLILTVPFTNKGEHIEHYPELRSYVSRQRPDGVWVADLEFDTGQKSTDESPCFHGGPGKTLELRVFNLKRIETELAAAGFTTINVLIDNIPEWGINWNPASRIIVAQKAK